MNIEALLLSARLALSVSAILFVVGVPLAYWLAYSRWRWKFLLEAVVALPLVLPPTVLGFYMLLAMGPRGRSENCGPRRSVTDWRLHSRAW